MNHAGEIRPLTRLVRPHVAIVTTVEPVHLAYFDERGGDRRGQGGDLRGPGAGRARRCSTATISWFDLLAERARDHGARIVSFGEHPSADMRLERVALQADGSSVQASLLGERRSPTASARRAGTSCRTRSPCSRRPMRSAPTWRGSMLALGQLPRAEGAGRADLARASGRPVHADRRELQRQPGLDARGAGAARPGEARRARAAGSPCSATCWSSATHAEALHRGLRRRSRRRGADLVFLAGPLMQELVAGLAGTPSGSLCGKRGGARTDSARGDRAGRRGHGEGLARHAARPAGRGAQAPLPAGGANDRAEPRRNAPHADLSRPVRRRASRSSTSSATSPSAPAPRR